MPVSDCDDVHILCVGRQGFQIVRVCRDHGSTRFSAGDHERIDGGATSGKPAEKRGTTGEGFGDGRRDIASLEEPVLDGVAPRVTDSSSGVATWCKIGPVFFDQPHHRRAQGLLFPPKLLIRLADHLRA
jgi:hypothetical protein